MPAVCVGVCAPVLVRVCVQPVLGWRDVTTDLQHFAKDKWGFYDAMFVSF